MEEQENVSTGKSRLAESINPEIGNGSLWEVNSHLAALRNVDPSKALESLLYSPHELQKLVDNKIALPEITLVEEVSLVDHAASVDEDIPVKKNGKKHKPKHKKKDKKIKAPVSPDDLYADKEVFPDVVTAEREQSNFLLESDSPEPENIKPEEKLPAEGKRMKKIIQAAEDEIVKQPEKSRRPEPSTETTLSPFTHWLKNLRGSEYVHPYNDDYALDQLANSTKGGISETFAELLAGQGYRDQAIEMYKLLMTRFPEKSSFFAAKIEALK